MLKWPFLLLLAVCFQDDAPGRQPSEPPVSHVLLFVQGNGTAKISGKTSLGEQVPLLLTARRKDRRWIPDTGGFEEVVRSSFVDSRQIRSESGVFEGTIPSLPRGLCLVELKVKNVVLFSRVLFSSNYLEALATGPSHNKEIAEILGKARELLAGIGKDARNQSGEGGESPPAFADQVSRLIERVEVLEKECDWEATVNRIKHLVFLLHKAPAWMEKPLSEADLLPAVRTAFKDRRITVPLLLDRCGEIENTLAVEMRLMIARRLRSRTGSDRPEKRIRDVMQSVLDLLVSRPLPGENGLEKILEEAAKENGTFPKAQRLQALENRFFHFGHSGPDAQIRLIPTDGKNALLTGRIDLPENTTIFIRFQRECQKWDGSLRRFVLPTTSVGGVPLRCGVKGKEFEIHIPRPTAGRHRVIIDINGKQILARSVDCGGAEELFSDITNHAVPVEPVIQEALALLEIVKQASEGGKRGDWKGHAPYKAKAARPLSTIRSFRSKTELSGTYSELMDILNILINANAWVYKPVSKDDVDPKISRLFPDPHLTVEKLEARIRAVPEVLARETRLLVVRLILNLLSQKPLSSVARDAQTAGDLLARFPLEDGGTSALIGEIARQTDESRKEELLEKLQALNRRIGVLDPAAPAGPNGAGKE